MSNGQNREEEKRALELLKQYHVDSRYNNLKILDEPDLQDNELRIGVEVVRCKNQNESAIKGDIHNKKDDKALKKVRNNKNHELLSGVRDKYVEIRNKVIDCNHCIDILEQEFNQYFRDNREDKNENYIKLSFLSIDSEWPDCPDDIKELYELYKKLISKNADKNELIKKLFALRLHIHLFEKQQLDFKEIENIFKNASSNLSQEDKELLNHLLEECNSSSSCPILETYNDTIFEDLKGIIKSKLSKMEKYKENIDEVHLFVYLDEWKYTCVFLQRLRECINECIVDSEQKIERIIFCNNGERIEKGCIYKVFIAVFDILDNHISSPDIRIYAEVSI